MIPLRDSLPSRSTPYVTIVLIIINVMIFLYQFTLDKYSEHYFVTLYGMTPDRFVPSTVFTSMFLHGGWMHLIGNMWFLWIFGDNVEDILGPGKYFTFYILCGVVAAMTHLAFNSESRVPTVGASGAIAGVMGAYLVKFPHSKIVTLIPIFVFLTTIEVPAVFILLYWFAIQLFSGFGEVGMARVNQGGVAWFAHIGGFVAGMLLVYAMRPKEKFLRRADLRW